jgi:hypothetical protein
MKSGRFSLKVKDFLKGLFMAVGTSVLMVIQNSIDQGEFTFKWKMVAMAAVGSTVVYLLKNFFTADIHEAAKTVEKAGGEVIKPEDNLDSIVTKYNKQ